MWEVLNTHRDISRQAYIQPLKEGIERLGKIAEFECLLSLKIGEVRNAGCIICSNEGSLEIK